MKALIVGGAYQGKEAYVSREYSLSSISPLQHIHPQNGAVLVTSLHLLVGEMLQKGGDPARYVLNLLNEWENWVVISNEIGSGIVPIDKNERELREITGRICCEIAARADRVERVICGAVQRIKGED